MSNNPDIEFIQEKLGEMTKTNEQSIAMAIQNGLVHSVISNRNDDVDKLTKALAVAVETLKKYEPYCVPLWKDVPGTNMTDVHEVWLAKETISQIREILK